MPAPEPINDALFASAAEAARKMACGTWSVCGVVEAHIRRIQEINSRLNAVVVPLFEQARATAKQRDGSRQSGDTLGPLHGIPITVKESFDVQGTPTTVGLTDRTDHRAIADAPPVSGLMNAGAVLLGKTNVQQLLIANETFNPVYGRTRNPWNLERTPGGSSGGEAAIVSAGGSMLGLGSDIGGSVRLPAHSCGICALKPTPGRLTPIGHFTVPPNQEGLDDQAGPMARHVADLALAMSVLVRAKENQADASVPPVPLWNHEDVKLGDLRVAYYTTNGLLDTSPALKRAVREAVTALKSRGVQVEEWVPPRMDRGWMLYLQLFTADGLAGVRRLLRHSRRNWQTRLLCSAYCLPHLLRVFLGGCLSALGQHSQGRRLHQVGRRSTDAYWTLLGECAAYRRSFLSAMDAGEYDAILCPPDALPAATHNSSLYLMDVPSYTAIYNLLGMPAGIVPATRVRPDEESDRTVTLEYATRCARTVERGSAGLPVGIQIVGRAWREDVVLAVMAALEAHFRALPEFPAKPPL